MNTRHQHKVLIRRLTASVLCICWLASFVYCQTLCLMGADLGHSNNVETSEITPSCHKASKASTPPCHSNPESSNEETGVHCCCSMDVISQSANQVDWVQSHDLLIPQLYLLIDLSLVSNSEFTNDYLSSQLWREWAFTPELRLGPSIRSHAPPRIS